MANDSWRQWLCKNRVPVVFLLILLLIMPMRSLWAPDEPNFAQCVREMREGGHWLLPYFNGEPYNQKPILFYWLMKGSAIVCDKVTGGTGFINGISAWALRLPSVLAAGIFVWAFQKWAARFASKNAAELSALVLVTTPIWIWQAQFIQIDMLFAALITWSWLAWLSGYLILRGEVLADTPNESRNYFFNAYIALGLAFLAKGPLALILSVALLTSFIIWQKDWKILAQMRTGWGISILLIIILPWYIAAGINGGAGYAYNMIIHQNLNRALNAWDHIQPWWRYALYIAGDLFP
ncbi:MAG: glycosyltransferase family 39 protein, partial [Holophagales bacterium]|nr:glycosyltransferase family 39 protein [Holophagales bacterium]